MSCRNAKCCARVKGLVELIIARNGNQAVNNYAYRLRAHSTPEWITEQLRAAAYVKVICSQRAQL